MYFRAESPWPPFSTPKRSPRAVLPRPRSWADYHSRQGLPLEPRAPAGRTNDSRRVDGVLTAGNFLQSAFLPLLRTYKLGNIAWKHPRCPGSDPLPLGTTLPACYPKFDILLQPQHGSHVEQVTGSFLRRHPLWLEPLRDRRGDAWQTNLLSVAARLVPCALCLDWGPHLNIVHTDDFPAEKSNACHGLGGTGPHTHPYLQRAQLPGHSFFCPQSRLPTAVGGGSPSDAKLISHLLRAREGMFAPCHLLSA